VRRREFRRRGTTGPALPGFGHGARFHWARYHAAQRTGPVADNGLVITVDDAAFEQMVATALDSLPADFAKLIKNVAVLVEHGPGPRGLLGLYEGIPLTSRTTNYAGVLPDRITIYQRAICALCDTEAQVIEQVRRTVIHEVGHYFGISDERLRELGW
jgi:predicted Zn-dependent protease with MMP-like domain